MPVIFQRGGSGGGDSGPDNVARQAAAQALVEAQALTPQPEEIILAGQYIYTPWGRLKAPDDADITLDDTDPQTLASVQAAGLVLSADGNGVDEMARAAAASAQDTADDAAQVAADAKAQADEAYAPAWPKLSNFNRATGTDGVVYKLNSNAIGVNHGDVADEAARVAITSAHGDVVNQTDTQQSYYYSTTENAWVEWNGLDNIPPNADLDPVPASPATSVSSWLSMTPSRQTGVINVADYVDGARFDSSTTSENLAAVRRAVAIASETRGLNTVMFPPGYDFTVNGRLDIPGNLKLDLNDSIIRPTHPSLIDLFVLNGSNIEMCNGQIEFNEGVLTRLIRTADGVNDVYLHNLSGVGDAPNESSIASLVRIGDGARICLEKSSANKMEFLADVDGAKDLFIERCEGSLMGGGLIWLAGETDNTHINDNKFYWHMLRRGLNNAIACEGESNGNRKTNLFIKGNLCQARPGVAHASGVENGASGDLIVVRNVDGYLVDGNHLYDSGEYGIDGVHGAKNGRIINNHIARTNVTSIAIGSFLDGGNVQTPTTHTIVDNNTIVDGGLDLDDSLPPDSVGNIRVYNADYTTIGVNHHVNGQVAITYRESYNASVAPQQLVNIKVESLFAGVNTFAELSGGSTEPSRSTRWEAGFGGTGAIANSLPQVRITADAVLVSTGVYDVTTESDTPDDVMVVARTISTAERNISVTRTNARTFRVEVTSSTGSPANSTFHLALESKPAGWQLEPMLINMGGDELDSAAFNLALPSTATSTLGAVIELSNYTVPAGISAHDTHRRALRVVTAADGSTNRTWIQ